MNDWHWRTKPSAQKDKILFTVSKRQIVFGISALECQDIGLCPTMLKTYPDLCSHPELAIQCNGTCLGNETCTGIPGPSSIPSAIGSISPLTVPITSPTDMSTTSRWMTTSKTYFFPDGMNKLSIQTNNIQATTNVLNTYRNCAALNKSSY